MYFNQFISVSVDARSELDLRIGAVFTRFQTLLLKNRFVDLSDQKVISYGSCQFPTLGFVVDKFIRAQNFIEEPFWKINVSILKDGITVKFNWERGHLFDREIVGMIYEKCLQEPIGKITHVEAKPKLKWPPYPLTTIEMQKTGSRYLKISSDRVMAVTSY
jgi:DNA topoisomerase-3